MRHSNEERVLAFDGSRYLSVEEIARNRVVKPVLSDETDLVRVAHDFEARPFTWFIQDVCPPIRREIYLATRRRIYAPTS